MPDEDFHLAVLARSQAHTPWLRRGGLRLKSALARRRLQPLVSPLVRPSLISTNGSPARSNSIARSQRESKEHLELSVADIAARKPHELRWSSAPFLELNEILAFGHHNCPG